MTGTRAVLALCLPLVAAGCTDGPFQSTQTATRFDEAPLGFSQNPKMTSALSQTFITNEAELQSVADRINAEYLDTLTQDDTDAVSARSAISPL